MSCIWMRTTGKTSPNTRPPSRGSSNSLDFPCVKKERSNEDLSHRIFVSTRWKHRSCRRPRYVVAALSRCEADRGYGNQVAEFPRAGFYGRYAQLDGHAPWIDRSATGSGADLSATVAEHRCE